jgi:tRNA-specific 2-thiouridylase
VLTEYQLAHALFPIGDTPKEQVRAEAQARGLAVAAKPDSHDICFIPDGDTRAFLTSHIGTRTGDIVDSVSGEVLGGHDGSFGFTVGQRRGLDLRRPAADGQPRYVLSIQPATNTVVVGPVEQLDADEITALRPVWSSGSAPGDGFECAVQIRAHGSSTPATVYVTAEGVVAHLHETQRSATAGQALVMYQGDTVLGSATIASARRAALTP